MPIPSENAPKGPESPVRTQAQPTSGSSSRTTRERIIESAEQLFAEQGFAGTSLRSIIADAGVNLAAVHYHFGSKDELILEVLQDKIRPVNEERARRLAALESSSDEPTLEGILACFIEPALRVGRDAKESAVFKRLVSRLHLDAEPEIESRLMAMFFETAARFVSALAKAAPHLGREEVAWRMQLCIGSMLYTMLHGDRIEQVLNRVRAEESPDRPGGGLDTDEAIGMLVSFLAGGFRAPATTTMETGE